MTGKGGGGSQTCLKIRTLDPFILNMDVGRLQPKFATSAILRGGGKTNKPDLCYTEKQIPAQKSTPWVFSFST